MGRYIGPKHRLSRRFAENIGGYAKTPLARKPYMPGQHGPTGKRRKPSTYSRGVNEKQKLKAFFNLRESAFRRYVDMAMRMEGNSGENLIQLLERRLDNMVYRMGLALTPRAARQLVAHGHVNVNGRKVDVSSYSVSPGDVVSLREKSKGHLQVKEAISQFKDLVPYVKRDDAKCEATLVTLPARSDIPVHIEERLVIEFLSR
ncbi:MAG: 30S ribosomal protein S4 [Planctomycetaceae bacterium]|nr:30S ribosomal protein S4 [Planctomycetaceae bacterium]